MDSSDDFRELETASEAFYDFDIIQLEELATASEFPHGVAPDETTWLVHAINSRNVESVAWALSKGVDVHFVDDHGYTALMTVPTIDSRYHVDKMLKSSLSVKVAATAIAIRLIDLLIKAGTDVNQRTETQGTALHAAVECSSIEVVQHLLTLGADPFAFGGDFFAMTPISMAKDRKRWEVHALLCDVVGLLPSGMPK